MPCAKYLAQDRVRCFCCLVTKLCPTLLWPHGLYVAIRLLCLWDFTAKNTEVGFCFLLQGIFPIQGSRIPALAGRFLTTEPPVESQTGCIVNSTNISKLLVSHWILKSPEQWTRRPRLHLLCFSHQLHTLGQNWDLEQFSLLQSPCLTHHVGSCLWGPGSSVWCWLELCIMVASPTSLPTTPISLNSRHQAFLVSQLQRQNLRILIFLFHSKILWFMKKSNLGQ